jgi:hypothetical protein
MYIVGSSDFCSGEILGSILLIRILSHIQISEAELQKLYRRLAQANPSRNLKTVLQYPSMAR